jgi:DNA polymerase III subunit gamma/tau
VTGIVAPVTGVVAPVTAAVVRPLGPALAPVGSALAPVGSALAPVTGPVAGLVPPVVPGGLPGLPGLPGSETGSPAGSGTQGPTAIATGFGGAAPALTVPAASQTIPARQAADGASSPAARSTRSWPALTGAVSLPGFPASAELPAGGPDPLSTSSGASFTLAALAAALLVLLGLAGRGRARLDRSGVLSRSYLPAVSPA